VGSEVSEAVVPLLGMYAASKHAVIGFNDALRVEIEDIDKAPVSITLIQPSTHPSPNTARTIWTRSPSSPPPRSNRSRWLTRSWRRP
jgi:short-subunit dehydrogenase